MTGPAVEDKGESEKGQFPGCHVPSGGVKLVLSVFDQSPGVRVRGYWTRKVVPFLGAVVKETWPLR